jgi:hypothetical protein
MKLTGPKPQANPAPNDSVYAPQTGYYGNP